MISDPIYSNVLIVLKYIQNLIVTINSVYFFTHDTKIAISQVIIKPGEYFEGEEVMDKLNEEVIAFDLITNLRKIGGSHNSSYVSSQYYFMVKYTGYIYLLRVAYLIDIRRLRCGEMVNRLLRRIKNKLFFRFVRSGTTSPFGAWRGPLNSVKYYRLRVGGHFFL